MAPFPFTDLPGGDLIEQGLADLRAGVVSIPSLLVQVGSPELQRLGFAVEVLQMWPEGELPEHQLYRAFDLVEKQKCFED
jgi:hypothetical protein